MNPAGSPPHTRDKSSVVPHSVFSIGIIPAYAGQIFRWGSCPHLTEDHPRIRGTNMVITSCSPVFSGSSPHTRDKFRFSKIITTNIRIIPAYAGQITEKDYDKLWQEDHPRIRGTNCHRNCLFGSSQGSSPHTRDKLFGSHRIFKMSRIIPAYAGQITAVANSLNQYKDHPRIRGTNDAFSDPTSSVRGSSPHTRDKS